MMAKEVLIAGNGIEPLKFIDTELDKMFDRTCDNVTIDLIRSASKSMVLNFPDNKPRNMAILHMLTAAQQLKRCLEVG
ncbi:hypothetical protein [uncultured Desulfosarcina sp.]|uniref:hypothetical protein n=1 Tax=uncultured Desulfosarcina sp. TaxID=218289 RepID=UPI0029C93BC9|nr:hypothetical protein [uncultured Desulfosarcina sp.]